ncbi:MAG: TIGR00282 family metallophosphoesterase [Bacillota bacterium]|nr:TIGR00282 family metallophosphoesterase [Bacillota bacterium]
MIGDIVGKPGRKCLQRFFKGHSVRNKYDLIIANGENAAGGAGLTEKVAFELKDIGIDVITGGNHSWDRREIIDFIEKDNTILRPANLPPETTPGNGSVVLEKSGFKIAVLNLMGRVFMEPSDCPFRVADMELQKLNKIADTVIVDFHAEATSEKQAMGWYLDGRIGALIGTHSHVQTADERILPGGTAYITDVGMTGLKNSVLGVDRECALKRFLTRMPYRLTITEGETIINAVEIEITREKGRATFINRIFELA